MIGDLVLLDGIYYLQANRNGTLVKVGLFSKIPFYKKLWLEFRDKFKKWDFNEALQFVQGRSKAAPNNKYTATQATPKSCGDCKHNVFNSPACDICRNKEMFEPKDA